MVISSPVNAEGVGRYCSTPVAILFTRHMYSPSAGTNYRRNLKKEQSNLSLWSLVLIFKSSNCYFVTTTILKVPGVMVCCSGQERRKKKRKVRFIHYLIFKIFFNNTVNETLLKGFEI